MYQYPYILHSFVSHFFMFLDMKPSGKHALSTTYSLGSVSSKYLLLEHVSFYMNVHAQVQDI